MRRITTLIALTLMLFGGLTIAAAPATAAPAEPFETDECITFGNYEFCSQAKGVIKRNESASGNTLYVANAQFCSQTYYFGELVFERCSRSHSNIFQQDGESQVYHSHSNTEQTFERGGITYTCTITYHYVYANGEVRLQDFQSECTPPLP